MMVIHTKSRVDASGNVNVMVPVGTDDAGREVEIVIRPASPPSPAEQMTELEWDAFVKATAGSWVGEPLVRADQGAYEKRDELK